MSASPKDSRFDLSKPPAKTDVRHSIQGSQQRPKSFPPANPAQIMRTAQKDKAMTSTMEQEVSEVMREILRNSRNKEDIIQVLKHLSQVLYHSCTSLSGLQTLGEEYSGILMLTGKGRIPSKLLLLEMILLKCFGSLLISALLKDGFFLSLLAKLQGQEPQTDDKIRVKKIEMLMKDIVICLPTLNTGLFYLMGDYYDISKRLTGIHYVIVHFWIRGKYSHSGLKFLGLFSLLYSLTQLVQAIVKFNCENVDRTDDTSQADCNVIVEEKSKCPFCFEARKTPAVTPCGHLFCWNCIMDALQVDNKCPLCRECVKPSRVVVLQNY